MEGARNYPNTLRYARIVAVLIGLVLLYLALSAHLSNRAALVECDNNMQLLVGREMQRLADSADTKNQQIAALTNLDNNNIVWNQLKWGQGPIKLLMNTSFGPVILETAPFHSMPTTLNHFLGLVETGYYKGCHFIRNVPHVLQGNCNFRQPKHSLVPKLSHQEYNQGYTHLKHTIGLAGRPAAIDFYVNLGDNVRNHGPGGQGPEADPCFAKVIEGVEVIDKIVESIKKEKEWLTAENSVLIHDISIITESLQQRPIDTHTHHK